MRTWLAVLLFLELGIISGQVIGDRAWGGSELGVTLKRFGLLFSSCLPLATAEARARRRNKVQEERRARVLATALRTGALDFWTFTYPQLPAPEECHDTLECMALVEQPSLQCIESIPAVRNRREDSSQVAFIDVSYSQLTTAASSL